RRNPSLHPRGPRPGCAQQHPGQVDDRPGRPRGEADRRAVISPRLARGLSVAGNAVLWVTALLGAISLVLGIATIAAGVQPLIFRASSMAPAIEAGALGLARTVDASEVKV